MFINNNIAPQKTLQQTLHHEITSLNGQFSNWKMIASQLPSKSSLPLHPLIPEINRKLDYIHGMIGEFCRNFDKELKSIKQKYALNNNFSRLGVINVESRPQTQEHKLQKVNQRISMLENNLKITQESQKNLVQTLNHMVKKYNDFEMNNKSRNQDYFGRSQVSSEANSSFLPLKICGQSSKASHSKSREKLTTQFNKKQQNKSHYISNDNSFVLDYSTQSNPYSSSQQQQQQFRMFSKPQQKMSLKNLHKHNRPIYLMEDRGSKVRQNSSRSSRQPVSLDGHDHRFKFMMHNLNQ